MANYVLLYTGEGQMPETEAEMAEMMAAWGAWMGGLGEALADGGNPTSGQTRQISADGGVTEGGIPSITGYSVITADSIEEAVELAKGCPIIAGGGSISVHETIEM